MVKEDKIRETKPPKIYPRLITTYPLRKNIVGKAADFVDDMVLNINGEKIFKQMGINPEKICLLYGPPGCGKTRSIEVINNEMNKEVLEEHWKNKENRNKPIGLDEVKLVCLEYSIGSMGSSFINMGSRNIQRFFEVVYGYAYENIPTLVVLDEVDALLIQRNSLHVHAEDKKLLETLMKHLQIAHDEPNVYVVMMSNLPELCDEASLRAGRVDKKYKFDLPNLKERKEAYINFICEKNKRAGYMVIRNYEVNKLAEMSETFNYADINSVVESAVRKRCKEIINKRRDKIITMGYIRQNRLEEMILEHKENFKKSKIKIGFK